MSEAHRVVSAQATSSGMPLGIDVLDHVGVAAVGLVLTNAKPLVWLSSPPATHSPVDGQDTLERCPPGSIVSGVQLAPPLSLMRAPPAPSTSTHSELPAHAPPSMMFVSTGDEEAVQPPPATLLVR